MAATVPPPPQMRVVDVAGVRYMFTTDDKFDVVAVDPGPQYDVQTRITRVIHAWMINHGTQKQKPPPPPPSDRVLRPRRR